jgi:hypothetical protein
LENNPMIDQPEGKRERFELYQIMERRYFFV